MLLSSTAFAAQRSYCFTSARCRHPTHCKPRFVIQSYAAAEDPVVSTQWLAEHLEEVRHYCCCSLLLLLLLLSCTQALLLGIACMPKRGNNLLPHNS
jgi:hypothetical protein